MKQIITNISKDATLVFVIFLSLAFSHVPRVTYSVTFARTFFSFVITIINRGFNAKITRQFLTIYPRRFTVTRYTCEEQKQHGPTVCSR